jgi:hypothetical protein
MFMIVYEKSNNTIDYYRSDASKPAMFTAQQAYEQWLIDNNQSSEVYAYAEMSDLNMQDFAANKYLYDPQNNSIVLNPDYVEPVPE